MSIVDACKDLTTEAAVLAQFVRAPGNAEPLDVTPFYGWRVRDTVAHMVVIDRLAHRSLSDPDAFEAELARFVQATRPPDPAKANDPSFRRIADYEDSRLGLLSWGQLLAAWDAGLTELCAAASRLEDDVKVKWFGGSMRLETLLNARQMEVWGYGQNVFDLYRAARPESDRLHNVAAFAVRTFGFSFANRGLPVPAERPYVALTAPSGALWTWNDAGAEARIEGSAVDFCHVATQRRNVADTALNLRGAVAEQWMRIAQ
jgi:uncharacterized protein (TIGR03084 family)